jgi:hypothetical protein
VQEEGKYLTARGREALKCGRKGSKDVQKEEKHRRARGREAKKCKRKREREESLGGQREGK